MPTVDYVKQLESENEELRQRLSSSESFIANNVFLKWTKERLHVVRKGKDPYETTIWFLQIGNQKVGLVREYPSNINNQILYGVETFKFRVESSINNEKYEHILVEMVDYPQMFTNLEDAKKICERNFSE